MKAHARVLPSTTTPAVRACARRYVHCLTGSDDPVFNFMRTTYDGRKVLSSFGDEDAEVTLAFEEAYRRRVAEAYPPARDGKTTLFPFRRFFLVARRPGILEAC